MKRAFSGILASLCLSGGIVCAETAGESRLAVDFETADVGRLTADATEQLFGRLEWHELGDRASVVSPPQGAGRRAMQVVYPAGGYGTRASGAQFVAKLPPAKEYFHSYRLRFSGGFPFGKGGKLPGLSSGGSRFTGGRKPGEGGGWSARYMWREGGALEIYLYHPKMSGDFGERHPLTVRCEPGRWYRLTQRVEVNDVGKTDGRIDVWVDDEHRLKLEGLSLRGPERGLVDSLLFSTFFGGGSADWAPPKTCSVFFDDVSVSTERPDGRSENAR